MFEPSAQSVLRLLGVSPSFVDSSLSARPCSHRTEQDFLHLCEGLTSLKPVPIPPPLMPGTSDPSRSHIRLDSDTQTKAQPR